MEVAREAIRVLGFSQRQIQKEQLQTCFAHVLIPASNSPLSTPSGTTSAGACGEAVGDLSVAIFNLSGRPCTSCFSTQARKQLPITSK